MWFLIICHLTAWWIRFAVAENFEEAGIRAIQAGLDVEYPRSKGFSYKMKESIESGRLSMDIIDQAVRRVLIQKFELGLFENPYPDLEKLKKYLHLKSADELNAKNCSRKFYTA